MDTNKPVATRLVQDVFSSGNMQVFDARFADDYTNHNITVPNVPSDGSTGT